MLKQKDTRIQLRDLIRSRISIYYPELSLHGVKIKVRLPRKLHTSVIYQVDIHYNGKLMKSLIVKKRIFNPFYKNDVKEDTRKEFENLKFLNNLSDRKFRIPRVLDALPEEGLLITEKVEGRSLYFYLNKFSYLPLTKAKRDFLEKIFRNVGMWLKEFHKMTYTGKDMKIDTISYIHKAETILSNFSPHILSKKLCEEILNRMKTLERDVLKYTFPVALKHGDFQPRNIIHNQDEVIVMDMESRKEDIIIKDVCNFITGITTFEIRYPSPWNKGLLNEFVDYFLETYFESNSILYSAIEFMKLLGLVESFESTYKRNELFLRKKMVAFLYEKKIYNLLTQNS